jgi:hypothetical protein
LAPQAKVSSNRLGETAIESRIVINVTSYNNLQMTTMPQSVLISVNSLPDRLLRRHNDLIPDLEKLLEGKFSFNLVAEGST